MYFRRSPPARSDLQGLSHFIRVYNYQNNLLSSTRLLNEVVRRNATARFVFASSIAVYGAAQIPFSEEMHPRPEDPYGIAKLAFEMDLAAAHRMFGQDFAVLRPHQCRTYRATVAGNVCASPSTDSVGPYSAPVSYTTSSSPVKAPVVDSAIFCWQ